MSYFNFSFNLGACTTHIRRILCRRLLGPPLAAGRSGPWRKTGQGWSVPSRRCARFGPCAQPDWGGGGGAPRTVLPGADPSSRIPGLGPGAVAAAVVPGPGRPRWWWGWRCIPRQQHQLLPPRPQQVPRFPKWRWGALFVFVNTNREIHNHTNTVVVFTQKYSKVSYLSSGK